MSIGVGKIWGTLDGPSFIVAEENFYAVRVIDFPLKNIIQAVNESGACLDPKKVYSRILSNRAFQEAAKYSICMTFDTTLDINFLARILTLHDNRRGYRLPRDAQERDQMIETEDSEPYPFLAPELLNVSYNSTTKRTEFLNPDGSVNYEYY